MYSRLLHISCCIMLLVACQKGDQKLDQVKVIGHAITGLYNYHALFPENTQEALRYAFAFEDLNGVEIDVQLSKDGTFWLFHDETLEERTNGKQRLCDHSDAELSSLRYNGIHGVHISQLRELDFSHGFPEKKTVFIDLKTFCLAPNLAERFAQDLEFLVQNWTDFVEFICIVNSADVAEKLRVDYAIDLPFYKDVSSKEEALNLSEHYSGVFIRNGQIDRTGIQAIQQSDLFVVVYEVRAPKSVRDAMRKSPDYILPDDFKVALIEQVRE